MQLKRLWDTEGKKIVFAEWPSGHECQVWTDETWDHLYIYDMAQWLTYNGETPAWKEYVRSNWVELEDQTVWFYDTNVPTELFNWDEGDEVSYVFKDWDGTVLKSWKIAEGQTPTAPADPTRAATAQYTYTFAWWNPTVWPISKRTVYTAQYEASPRNYTVTIGVSPEWAGTVDTQQVTVAYGTEISYTSNVLMIGSNEITATAETGYEFYSWGTLPATVTGDVTVTATFRGELCTISTTTMWPWSVSPSSITARYGDSVSASGNVLTIWGETITATWQTWFLFDRWMTTTWDLPATVTGAFTVMAVFAIEQIPVESITGISPSDATWPSWEPLTFSMTYLPINANDFSWVELYPDSYSEETWAEISNYNTETWTATISVTGNPEAEDYYVIKLNWQDTGYIFEVSFTS